MKVRIGLGIGSGQALGDSGRFGEVVDLVEALGFDSLWVSDRVVGESLDPVVALAVAAGRTARIKLGANVFVLPGRDPFLVAKQLASLDRLSGGRLLPAFGLGAPSRADRSPFGVGRGQRVAAFVESLDIIQTLWAGREVPHPDGGKPFALSPGPTRPLDIWFGARNDAALRRTGRRADGWIGSFQTPRQAAAARATIDGAADAAGRTVDPEHFGMTIVYARNTRTERGRLIVGSAVGSDGDLAGHAPAEETEVYPCGAKELVAVIEAHVAVGVSKFVVTPLEVDGTWQDELRWLREVTGPLERDA
ncbi:MAG: LLM class flavin-dependent oxidoreductase [Actinobacteria bacterium]|nr:LLM class flavin-dependent oxidoreductase [Actinomycetota bacterium]